MQPVRIQIQTDEARAILVKLTGKVSDRRGLNTALGLTAEAELQEHFLKRNQEPNKRGWPKQNFWARIRRATAFSGATDDKATVTISDPAYAAKVHGAEYGAKEKKYLAIPMRAEAYGVRPSSGIIEDLFVIRSRRGNLFLAKREGEALRLYYKLVRRVRVAADPAALPDRSAMDGALTAAAQDFLDLN